jgi:ubiquinone/menaquinone biosynthesis C-methylase UbiE
VEPRVLDAERMDLEDDSVDGVLCRWGYMLMAEPETALRETRRVLCDGGRLALSVWAAPESNPWASVPGRLLREQTGAPPQDPTAPGVFAMADPERTRSLLTNTGFEVRRLEDVGVNWLFEDFDAYWTFLNEHAGAIAVGIAVLSEEDKRALRGRIEEAVEPYRANSKYELPGLAQNTLAA